MSLLNFNDSENKSLRNRKNLKTVLGIGALVGTVAIGSTLAASINLNSGGPVEFGQGVAHTTACDNDIVLIPFSAFVNSVGEGSFSLSAITLSGIDSSIGKCANKDFVIKAYDESSGSPLNLFDSVNSITVTDTGSEFTIPTTSGLSISTIDDSTFTLNIDSSHTPIAAESVYRFTIESKDPTETAPTSYEVGDTGPGGGTVFYVDNSPQGFSETGATCSPSCRYLEAAPTNPALLNYWTDEEYAWSGNTSESVGTTDESFGTGWMNTSQSINQPNGGDTAGNAVTVAHAYRGPYGLTDWFLPSKSELNQMCKWQGGEDWVSEETTCTGGTLNSGVGATGFMSNSSCGYFSSCYWSSSETGADGAWFQLFNSGDKAGEFKTYLKYVRPIRAF